MVCTPPNGHPLNSCPRAACTVHSIHSVMTGTSFVQSTSFDGCGVRTYSDRGPRSDIGVSSHPRAYASWARTVPVVCPRGTLECGRVPSLLLTHLPSTQHSTISLIARPATDSYGWRMADPARAGREFRSRVGRRRGDLEDLLHHRTINRIFVCASLSMRARTTSVQPVCPGIAGWAGGQRGEGVFAGQRRSGSRQRPP